MTANGSQTMSFGTAWAEVQGSVVTIHNLRDCDYRTELDYTRNPKNHRP